MKKKFTLNIKSPCSENFGAMIPNQYGSFCSSCAKNVIDLSTKTNSEVAHFIALNKDKSVCARVRTSQLEEEFEYNEISKTTQLRYAAAVAASVLLMPNMVAQETYPPKATTTEARPVTYKLGKVAYPQSKNEVISFTLQGKILDKATRKPLLAEKYPNLFIMVSGTSVKVDPKTGEYSIPVTVDKKVKEIYITIMNEDYSYAKIHKIDFNAIKTKKAIPLNFLIDPEKEMHQYKIAGGLGVNYIGTKKSNPSS